MVTATEIRTRVAGGRLYGTNVRGTCGFMIPDFARELILQKLDIVTDEYVVSDPSHAAFRRLGSADEGHDAYTLEARRAPE